MTNVGFPILIYGEPTWRSEPPCIAISANLTPEIAPATYPEVLRSRRTATPIYRDIVFSDITATAQSGHCAGLIWGLPEAAVNDVLLRNVAITADRPFAIYNAQNVRLENCQITTPSGVEPFATSSAKIETVAR